MTTELVKIDPKQFGLEESKAAEITKGLTTVLSEREVLTKRYLDLIETEITPESIRMFRELRLQVAKNRTQGLVPWHKANKAYFLAGGNFVQAIFNKEVAENERMEEKLMEGEKYFERIEAERIARLETERTKEISQYSDVLPSGLGKMDEAVYVNYLSGLKLAYEARIKAEQEAEAARIEAEKQAEIERIEKERIVKLHNDRKEIAIPYYAFWTDFEKTLNFGEQAEDDFNAFIERIKKAKSDHEAEQERIKVELEKQKAAAEKREKEIEAERKKQAEILERKKARDIKRNAELKPYIIFIRNYSDMLEMDENTYQKEFSEIKKGAQEHWEFERKEQLRKQKEQEEAEIERKRLQAEIAKKEAAEIEAKKEAERKENERIEAEKKAAKAPKKEKLTTWIDGFVMGTPIGLNDDATVSEILAKFESFKRWAKNLIETI